MPDLASVAIAAGAAIALFRFKLGVIPVILAAGALGVVLSLSAG
jgi:chromate transporter